MIGSIHDDLYFSKCIALESRPTFAMFVNADNKPYPSSNVTYPCQ